MWEQIFETAAQSGIWAILFVALFCFQIKDSKTREEKYQSTIDALAEKLKMIAEVKAVVEDIKDKIADKRAERDKAAMENYIIDLLCYAEYCQEIALAAAIDADMTLLEAAEVAADYVEKYGEPESVETEATEA